MNRSISAIGAWIIVLLLLSGNIWAKDYVGNITTEKGGKPVAGAAVRLLDSAKVQKYQTVSRNDGNFRFKDVKDGKYILRISFVGFKPIEFLYTLNEKTKQNLGHFELDTAETKTGEVVVEADAILGEMVGDTAQYNADAFKVDSNAKVDKLLERIPGVEVQSNGKVKARGKEVEIILVDGRIFFGSDPKIVLDNIPAKIVDKVQVYDKATDRNEFLGNDLEKNNEAINLVIKKDRKVGYFGEFGAGGGTRSRYELGAFLANMNGPSRLSIIGGSNNTNRGAFDSPQSFVYSFGRDEEADDMLSSGFITSNEVHGAIARNRTGGFHYGNDFGIFKKCNITYIFKKRNIDKKTETERDYFPANDSSLAFSGGDKTGIDKYYHRFKASSQSIELSKRHAMQMTFSGSYEENTTGYSSLNANSYHNGMKLNNSATDEKTDLTDKTFASEINYRYKFDKPGRTLGLTYNLNYNDEDGATDRNSVVNYYTSGRIDSIRRHDDNYLKNARHLIGLTSTEQLSEVSKIAFDYNYSLQNRHADRSAYNRMLDQSALDTTLSNQYINNENTHTAKFEYRLKTYNWLVVPNIVYKNVSLSGENKFPYYFKVDYSASRLMPNLLAEYRLSHGKSSMGGLFGNNKITLNYNENMGIPSLYDLREVLDNSNPIWLTIGNPKLEAAHARKIDFRFNRVSEDYKTTLSIGINGNFTDNAISNNFYTAKSDTVIDGIALAQGVSLTRPVNLDGQYDWELNGSYSYHGISFRGGTSYSRIPTIINGNKIKTHFDRTFASIDYFKNFNKFVIMLNLLYSYNKSGSSASGTTFHNEYHRLDIYGGGIWHFYKTSYIDINMNNNYYFGSYYDNGDYNNYSLEIELGTTFLQDKFSLTLSAVDVLKNRKSITNTTYADYTEFIRHAVLRDYILLKLVYKFNTLGKDPNAMF